MGYLFVTEEGVTDHSITAVDILSKSKCSAWHKSSMKKGIWTDVLALTLMQGGATAIPRDGYLVINYIYT